MLIRIDAIVLETTPKTLPTTLGIDARVALDTARAMCTVRG